MINFFFFNDTATTEIYTLSLHDALPIFLIIEQNVPRTLKIADRAIIMKGGRVLSDGPAEALLGKQEDRKSTRLNSSHGYISYAVFCLKKKKINKYYYKESFI